MLDSRYEVKDNSWPEYPSAVLIEQLIQHQKGVQFEPEPEADSLIAQIALSVGKNINVPSKLSREEQKLMLVAFKQAEGILSHLKKRLNLSFDTAFKDKRLWLLDSSWRRLASGFFNNLIIDRNKSLGIVLKHYLGKQPPIPIKENKELQTLALIAAEAFKLKEVIVSSLWVFSHKPALYSYNYEQLQLFKEEVQIL
jgi:hypothetical protein